MKRCWIGVLLLTPFIIEAQTGIISTYAGCGTSCMLLGDGGPAVSAQVNDPDKGTFDKYGNYYFAEALGKRVREVDTLGIITTVVGNGSSGALGDGGPATAAELDDPSAVVLDSAGNLYISDLDSRVRKVDIATGIITTIVGNGTGAFFGDGGPATAAEIFGPSDMCFDKKGNLYIVDDYNYRIRKVNTMGIISTFAGAGFSPLGGGDGGPATAATFSLPSGIAIDDTGNVYVADGSANKVRKIDTFGVITTFAGNGTATYTGDGIPATAAQIAPARLAFDTSGDLFVADPYNRRAFKVDLAGIIHCIAGNGSPGYSGDGVTATATSLDYPSAVSFDPCGNLYIPEPDNMRVRRVALGTSVTATITISAGPGDTICAGTAVTFTSTATNGGPSPSYQWYVNGTFATGATSSTYTYTPVNGDSVSCLFRTSVHCASSLFISSNTLHMVVSTVTPAISISASPGDTVCSGTPVTYMATVTGAGVSPAYQWFVNGTVYGASATYGYTPANGDSIRCVLTSDAVCATPSAANSNTIQMVVNAPFTPTISISVTPSDTVCAGTTVTLHATITGGGLSPSYHWYINTVLTGVISSIYTYTPAAGDSARCVLTSSAACASPGTVSSNTVHFVVNPLTTPTISISASPGDTVCSGTSVTYTSVITGGGLAPAYQWLVEGVGTGTLSSYSYVPVTGDAIRCVLTSSAECATPATDSSNTLHMVVNPIVIPSVSIAVSPSDTVCTGTLGIFTATATNGGASPIYQWIKNGSPAGTGATTYIYIPADADSVRCILTSDAVCATPPTVSSITVNMVVDTFIEPSISITGLTTALAGSTVSVTATVANAGSSYTIRWMNHGIEFASTTVPSVTYTKTASIDTITATIVPTGESCYDSTTSVQFIVADSNTAVHTVMQNGLSIYPNPVSETINIDFPGNISSLWGRPGGASYRLISMIGSVVLRGNLSAGSNSISVRSLATGVYVLEIADFENQKTITKIIKE